MSRVDNALVLSGGGAKGRYQVEALKEIRNAGIEFDVISGTSVGAINGAMLATGQINRLYNLWDEITEEKVHKRIPIIKLLSRYIRYKIGFGKPVQAIFDNKPFIKLLNKHLDNKEPDIPFYSARVNIETGEYESTTNKENLTEQVLASASIPMVWKPVNIDDKKWVDGGIRNISPIGEVIKHRPKRIFIITTETYDKPKHYGKVDDIFDMVESTIGIMLNEIFNEDLKRFFEINELVKQTRQRLYNKKGKILRYYKPILIHPSKGLGSALDYSKEKMSLRAREGRKDAKRILRKSL